MTDESMFVSVDVEEMGIEFLGVIFLESTDLTLEVPMYCLNVSFQCLFVRKRLPTF
jgi:hypothetical protein